MKKKRLQELAGSGCLIYWGSEWGDSEDCSFVKIRLRGWWQANYPHGKTSGATFAPHYLGANFTEAEILLMLRHALT